MSATEAEMLKRLNALSADTQMTHGYTAPEQGLDPELRELAETTKLYTQTEPMADEQMLVRKAASKEAMKGGELSFAGLDTGIPVHEDISEVLVPFGYVRTRIPKGVEHYYLSNRVEGLKRVIEGKPTYIDLGFGESVEISEVGKPDISPPTPEEKELARKELPYAEKALEDFRRQNDREIATYEMGMEKSGIKKFVSEMAAYILSPESLIVPGQGPAKTGQGIWNGLKRLTGRSTLDGAVAAGLSGLEYMPEGLDRHEQMMYNLFFGGLLRSGMDLGAGPTRAILSKMQGRDLSADEFRGLVGILSQSNPELDVVSEQILSLYGPDFVNTQLSRHFSPEEIESLPEPVKERLAVFAFMDSEASLGQILRNPQMMSQEKDLANMYAKGDFPGAEEMDKFFREQWSIGKRKLDQITGESPSALLGSDIKNIFEDMQRTWKGEWDDLYALATETADPNVTFNIESMVSALIENNVNFQDAPNMMIALKNVNQDLQWKLNVPYKEMTQLRKKLNAEFGNEALIEIMLLQNLMRRKGGINALEAEEILKKFNAQDAKTRNDRVIRAAVREGLLADTIDGTGVDVFKQARDSFSSFRQLLEQFPIAKKLGLDPDTKAWSADDIAGKLVFPKGKIEDFEEFMALLDDPRFEEVKPVIINSMRDEIFSFINKKSKGTTVGEDNRSTFNAGGFRTAMDHLSQKSGNKKMAALLTEEERTALATIYRYTQFLQQPPKGGGVNVYNPPDTAIQSVAAAMQILNSNSTLRDLARMIKAVPVIGESIERAITARQNRYMMQGSQLPGMLRQAGEAMQPPAGMAEAFGDAVQMVPSRAPLATGEEGVDEEAQRQQLIQQMMEQGGYPPGMGAVSPQRAQRGPRRR